MTRFVKTSLLVAIVCLLTLSSCASYGFGSFIPYGYDEQQFENDVYLIVGDVVINKQTDESFALVYDEDATIPNTVFMFYYSDYIYDYVLKDSEIEQYRFLEAACYDKSLGNYDLYYDCVITYNYDGEEIGRKLLSDPLTESEFENRRNEGGFNVSQLRFDVNRFSRHSYRGVEELLLPEHSSIILYAEALQKSYGGSHYQVRGTSKAVDDEIWFSLVSSQYSHYNSGGPIIEGVFYAELFRCTPDGEFETIFKCDEKETAIVNFDKNGVLMFSSNGTVSYFDFETKTKNKLNKQKMSMGADISFDMTDDYICVFHRKTVYEHLFVCKRDGTPVADTIIKNY